jgi:uncharacterized phosphosugar-binding protein
VTDLVGAYYQAVTQMLHEVMETQGAAIRAAGRMGAEAIQGGGLIHAFGTGHSHMLAEELFTRAGGLVLVNAIFEPSLMLHEGVQRSSALERLPGYAQQLLDLEPMAEGDLRIIASNSGRNAVPVEAAMYARQRGLKVVAITSLAHSRSQTPNHASGKRLFELADIVIDNGGVPGDAVLEVPGSSARACATSTVVGGFIVQAMAAANEEGLVAAGVPLPILKSGNMEGSKVHNQQVKKEYGERIKQIRAYLG